MTNRLDTGFLEAEGLGVGHGYVEAGGTISALTPLDLFLESGWHVSNNVTAFVRGDVLPTQHDWWSAVAGLRFKW